jgi:heme-degrading monooxygenase HmoA
MTTALTIIRYRKRFIPFALLAMALHRIPLWLHSKITFWKLLGCGKNGSFDKHPDWQQWGILTVRNPGSGIEGFTSQTGYKELRTLYGNFIAGWLRFFKCEIWTIYLEPLEGHGLWNKKKAFGELHQKPVYDGPIAVLTRATIRLSKLRFFWKHVEGITQQMPGARGFISSIGIGEMPLLRQATFSIWQSREDMKNFAYNLKAHKEVIAKTRAGKWYSEELFVRFKILRSSGSIKGLNPMDGML